MHKYFVFAAYGWLTFIGILHFAIDVVSQYVRGNRPAGAETTLYYGMNAAFSLGQVAFGLLGLWIAWRAIALLGETPVLILSIAASLGWLALTFLCMGYWEPRLNVGIFCALILAVAATA